MSSSSSESLFSAASSSSSSSTSPIISQIQVQPLHLEAASSSSPAFSPSSSSAVSSSLPSLTFRHSEESSAASSLDDDGEGEDEGSVPFCRICHEPATPSSPLFIPCKCRGSIAFTHSHCLEEWRHTSPAHWVSCSVCRFPYRVQKSFLKFCFPYLSILCLLLGVCFCSLIFFMWYVFFLSCLLLCLRCMAASFFPLHFSFFHGVRASQPYYLELVSDSLQQDLIAKCGLMIQLQPSRELLAMMLLVLMKLMVHGSSHRWK